MNIKWQVVVSLAFVSLMLFVVALRVPSYEVDEGSYGGAKLLIEGNEARVVGWYAPSLKTLGAEGAFGLDYTRAFWKDFKRDNGRIPNGNDILMFTRAISAEELYLKMVELSVSHFALTCRYDDPWSREEVARMERFGMLTKLWEKDCAALYEVNYVVRKPL